MIQYAADSEEPARSLAFALSSMILSSSCVAAKAAGEVLPPSKPLTGPTLGPCDGMVAADEAPGFLGGVPLLEAYL